MNHDYYLARSSLQSQTIVISSGDIHLCCCLLVFYVGELLYMMIILKAIWMKTIKFFEPVIFTVFSLIPFCLQQSYPQFFRILRLAPHISIICVSSRQRSSHFLFSFLPKKVIDTLQVFSFMHHLEPQISSLSLQNLQFLVLSFTLQKTLRLFLGDSSVSCQGSSKGQNMSLEFEIYYQGFECGPNSHISQVDCVKTSFTVLFQKKIFYLSQTEWWSECKIRNIKKLLGYKLKGANILQNQAEKSCLILDFQFQGGGWGSLACRYLCFKVRFIIIIKYIQ